MDWLQLSSSLIAIVLLALLAGKLFPASRSLTNDRVLRAYKRYAPNSNPATPIISQDGQASLLPMADKADEIGLVTQLGDRLVSRTITPNPVVSWSIDNNQLRVTHGDFTQPEVIIQLPPDATKAVRNLLTEFEGKTHAA